MTPEAFAVVAQGYMRRQAKSYEQAAWIVAHLLSPYQKRGQKRLTPDALLSPAIKRILRGPRTSKADD